jgi:hypothetical protein
MADVWNYACDMTETATGLSVTVAGAVTYLNSATVTYALLDAAFAPVSISDVPVTGSYTYTAASSGDYTAPIESTVTGALTVGAKYYLAVTVVSGSYNDKRYLARRIARRT